MGAEKPEELDVTEKEPEDIEEKIEIIEKPKKFVSNVIVSGLYFYTNDVIEISKRSRGTPRVANRLLRRVRDYAQVNASGKVNLEIAKKALDLFEIDEKGFDRIDRAILDALINKFGGGPVGLSTLAVAVGEEPETVEDMCEPYLVRVGYLARSARGRIATPLAYKLLGKNVPAQQILDITE